MPTKSDETRRIQRTLKRLRRPDGSRPGRQELVMFLRQMLAEAASGSAGNEDVFRLGNKKEGE